MIPGLQHFSMIVLYAVDMDLFHASCAELCRTYLPSHIFEYILCYDGVADYVSLQCT